jgi:hypothetical protein
MPALHEQIAELESRIGELAAAAERCRKTMIAAKIGVAVGIVLLAILSAGLLRSGALTFVLGITAVLGGIALFGSTKSTRDQIVTAIRTHEEERAEMISRLELRDIGGETEVL